jgi:acyl-CoA oxidase
MTSTRVNRQLMLMQKAREGASFNTFELTCLIHGGYDISLLHYCTFISKQALTHHREDVVQQRRAALKRVEISSGTHDTSILPRCYANMNREEAFDEGLKMGSIAFTDGLKHKHHFFHVATPRYTLGNSR